MTALQNIVANSGAIAQLNENFDAVSPAGLYGRRAPAVVGLTWAYYGGRGFGNTIADGTVALTGSTTNYVVASRSTGAVTASTSITNWNDTTNYYRLYLIVTGSASITTATDYREFAGGGTPGGSFTGGTLSSALNEAPPVTLASAATVNIGAAAANTINITGTTTITAFDSIAAGAIRRVIFAAALTLTHNATSLILPTGANITTAAGDAAEFVSLGSGNWKCIGYTRASGAPLTGGGSFTGGTLTSALNEAVPVTIASASTMNIGAAAANSISVTGTTAVTAFDNIAAGAKRDLVFAGALTLTHNATSLILPTGGNITTATGDVADFVSLGSGNWRCVNYMRANGQALSTPGGGFTGGTLTSALNEAPQVALASAATVNIGAAAANTVTVSGTTTITAFDTIATGAIRRVRFLAALTLTHNATSLILPGSANITTAAGDVAVMESLGSGNWRCITYFKADGTAVVGGGGGGVTGFTSSLNTTSPNNSVNVSRLLASGGTTDQHVVLQPKGTGGLLAQLPDGSSTGGNIRGTNAVDWQTKRSAATQIANGASAVISGGENNSASGAGGTVVGGVNNLAGGINSVVGGQACSTSAQGAVALGSGCVANGAGSVALGQASTAASSSFSAAIGWGCQSDGGGSVALGYDAIARVVGSLSHASSKLVAIGDHQVERLVQRRVTTSATPLPLSATGGTPAATTCALLVNNSVYAFEIVVVGKNTTFGDRASYKITGQIARGANAAATVIDGTPTITTIAAIGGASAWSVAVSANTTLGSLEITATGAASATVLWVANITLTEVVG
ncbi:MAG TPA: hypothetical protein VN280_22540 [Variovorax sp.]|nr:hypothetical protein [Variovorax sp.]